MSPSSTDSGITTSPEYLALFATTVACFASALNSYLIPSIITSNANMGEDRNTARDRNSARKELCRCFFIILIVFRHPNSQKKAVSIK